MLRTLLAAVLLAAAGIETQGTVVVARTQGNAMILWDVTPAVAPLVATAGTADSKIERLEIGAAKVLLSHLDQLPSADTVTVRVIYQKTGEVSPVYKTATFLGVEKVFEITASRSEAVRERSAWQEQLDKNVMPPKLTVKVTGALPAPA